MPATYSGIGVSNGVAAGPVARVHGPVLPPRDGAPIDVEAETDRAVDALDAVGGELEALAQRAGASGAVLVRQARISRDPSLASLVTQLVSSGRAAPRAAWEGFGAYRDMRAADPMRAVPGSGGARRHPRPGRRASCSASRRPASRTPVRRSSSSPATSRRPSPRGSTRSGCWRSSPSAAARPATPPCSPRRSASRRSSRARAWRRCAAGSGSWSTAATGAGHGRPGRRGDGRGQPRRGRRRLPRRARRAGRAAPATAGRCS